MPLVKVDTKRTRYQRSGVVPRRMSPKIRKITRFRPVFGREAKSADGYKLLWFPGKGYLREHRLVAGQALGRRLRYHEHVHHIDGNKSNNSKSNLLVCTKDYHKWLHYRCQDVFGTWHLPGRNNGAGT